MNRPYFRRPYDPDRFQTHHHSINRLPSITVPNMLLTLKEMLERHVQGLPVPTFEGVYDPYDLPDPRSLDLTEIEDYRSMLAERVAFLQAPPSPIEDTTPLDTLDTLADQQNEKPLE